MKKVSFGKVIGNIIFYTVLAAFIFVSCIMLKAKKDGVQPSVFGYKFYIVLTGSMTPTIYPGELVVVKDIKPSEVKQGDIITFGSPSSENVTTHRVKQVDKANGIQFVTKGDANNVEDPNPVQQKYLIGRVTTHIAGLGTVMQSIQNHLKAIIIIILASAVAIAIITYCLKIAFTGGEEKNCEKK